MTTNKRQSYFTAKMLFGLLFLATAFSACKKTEYEQLMRPYNNIERFTISGYGELDSIGAVVAGDSIKVYWSGDTELPQKIRPSVKVSAGAAISPASGEEVAFSESTVYTVTAEDGTVRKYVLKPVVSKAIPVLAGFVNELNWNYSGPDWQWGNGKKLKINGQYFLHYNDASSVKVYAQRLRDGYEFDLPVDPEQTTSTQVALDLPKLTAELDSGMHRIWVKVGDFPSNGLDVWIAQPQIADITKSVTLREAGQPIYIGDSLHFTLEVDETRMEPELFEKYFNGSNYLYYQARASFLVNDPYAVYSGDNSSQTPDEQRARVNGKQITIPVTEDLWGKFVGVHEYSSGSVYLKSELFLYSVTFEFNIKAYPHESIGQPIRNRVSVAAIYADLETRRKTTFKRRGSE